MSDKKLVNGLVNVKYAMREGAVFAPALWFDNVHVCVACPYCDEEHIHGSCGGRHWAGYRTPHCAHSRDMPDYYVALSTKTLDKRPAYAEVFV